MTTTSAPGEIPHYRGAPLTDRLNSEPPILNGISETEASYLGVASFVISLGIGIVFAAMTKYWLSIAVICIIFPLLTLWYGSLYLQKIKRGKPEGCYLQAARIYLARHGVIRNPYLAHDGYFEIGRRFKI